MKRIVLILLLLASHTVPVQASSPLTTFENAIRNLKVEWAGCFDPTTGIEQWRGTSNRYDSVDLNRLLCFGTTMTHNHPAGLLPIPSQQDWKVARELKLYQLRVVSRRYTCVIEKAWKTTTATYQCHTNGG